MTTGATNWAGDMVRELRAEAGIDQETLAERACLGSRIVVSNFERGAHRSLLTFERMLDALGYELEVVKK